MNWEQLIDDRTQTSSWDMDREVSVDILNDIMDEIHRRSPSKQNIVQYNINIIGWDDIEFRNKFKEFTIKDPTAEQPMYNTQTLAQYLIVLTKRAEAPFDRNDDSVETDLTTHWYNKFALPGIEIGMAAVNIAMSAKDKGLDTGFCRCFDWNYEHIDDIVEYLGVESPFDIHLSIGIGYGSDSKRTLDKTTDQQVYSEVRSGTMWQVEPKPNKTTYVKFL